MQRLGGHFGLLGIATIAHETAVVTSQLAMEIYHLRATLITYPDRITDVINMLGSLGSCSKGSAIFLKEFRNSQTDREPPDLFSFGPKNRRT